MTKKSAAPRPPPTPRLARRHGHLRLPPALIVACEGATEVQVLTELRARWGIPQATIKVMGQQGVPETVVEEALKEQRKHTPRPEVWVVFDRDEHGSWLAAIHRAQALGFKLAVSNPCFELWGLLLHRDHTAPIHRHQAQRDLAQLHPGYHHDKSPWFDIDTVLAHLDDAPRRSATLARRAQEAGDPRGNPTTCFSDLVVRLKALAP